MPPLRPGPITATTSTVKTATSNSRRLLHVEIDSLREKAAQIKDSAAVRYDRMSLEPIQKVKRRVLGRSLLGNGALSRKVF